MAEFNGKQGRWVTTKDGRKVFLEDEVDKQEREIAEAKKRIDSYNSNKTESDPVRDNALYKGLAKEADRVLGMNDSDFESLTDKSVDLYGLMGKFAKAGINSGETYERIQREVKRNEAVTNMGYINTGRYSEEVKKYSDNKTAQRTAKQAVESLIENQTEFERDEQSGISGEMSASDWLSGIGLTDQEVSLALKGKFDYTLACKLLGKLGSYNMYGQITKERVAKVLKEDYDVDIGGNLLDDAFKYVKVK